MSRRWLRPPSPRHGCARRGCRNARATTESWRRRRVGPPAWWRRNRGRWGSAGSWCEGCGGFVDGGVRRYLLSALPSAKTELGAVILIGLTTGTLEMARLIGASSIDTPLASRGLAHLLLAEGH